MSGQIEIHRDGPGLTGPAAAAGDSPAWLVGDRRHQPGQGLVFGTPLGEPHIVGGHGLAVPFFEGRAGAVDEFFGLLQLPGEGLFVALIGDEHRTGQTGVALLAGLQRRQQAPAVGEDPVGAVE